MATITAKYPSTCPACRGPIHQGDQIDWTKGSPAIHSREHCRKRWSAIGPAAAPAAAAARVRSAEPRACAEGEQVVERKSKSRDDIDEVGTTFHAPKVHGQGGGDDGHYWTVIEAGKYHGMDHDDEPQWMCWAIVRAATADEAAPVMARIQARKIREQLARDLNALRGEPSRIAMPATSAVLVPPSRLSLAATGERVAIVDGAILHERVGDPDMSDSWRHYVVRIADADPALVERVAALIAATATEAP